MLKKMLATAGLVAGLALVAPSGAFADTGYQSRTVDPGQTWCLQDSVLGTSTAHGEGVVLSGHNVRFTFGTFSPVVKTVFDSAVPVSAFAFDATPYNTRNAFPGRFQACAINQSLKTSSVRLYVSSR
jgi:hypothetical protein